MIKIKNVSTSIVSLYAPTIKLNRELTPGRSIPVSDEEYEELTFDPGFLSLINGHYIVVEGIEKEKQVAETGPVFDAAKINDMLIRADVTALAKFLPTATEAEKDSLITLAVEHRITNAGIAHLIKKYCDVDIINAINVKHESEEK